MKVNSGQAPSTLVPEYLGSDFDAVLSCADNMTDIKTVVGNLDDIEAVVANIGVVNTVAPHIDDVDVVSRNISSIGAVLSNMGTVTTVANDIANVNAVAPHINDVDVVSNNMGNVVTVINNLNYVKNVTDNITNVVAVGSHIDDVDVIANNIGDVNTVANNIDDMGAVATNIEYVKGVAEGIAGLPVVSYIGTTPPPLAAVGAEWYCTADGRTYVYYHDGDSAQWIESSPQSTIGVSDTIALWKRSLAEIGLTLVGTFQDGCTVTAVDQAVLDFNAYTVYQWKGTIPAEGKVIPINSTPATVGGVSPTAWVDRTDGALRSELSSAGGETLVASVGSVSDLMAIQANDGDRVTVKSYKSGWAASNSQPVGGGTFVFVTGSTLDDRVMNFAASGGSWRRSTPSATIDAAMAGMSPANTAADNDAAFARLRSYCVANNEGFTINGMHNVSAQIDTDGITFITGGDGALGATGFSWSGKASGDVCFLWGRKTRISDLAFLGQNVVSGASNGVTGISGHQSPKGMYTNRAQRIFVSGFGTGIHMHDAVACEIDGYRISNCHTGLLLDGFFSNAEYSTTLGFKNGYLIGNVDAVVGGSNGVGLTAAVSINFHNTILEQNSGCGFICDSGVYNGTTYNSLDLRDVVFSGYTWFELNTYAYVFRRVRSLYITGPFRLEANSTQLTVPTEFFDDTVSVSHTGWFSGIPGRRGQLVSGGTVIYRDGVLGAGVVIGGLYAQDESGVIASALEITQQTDGVVEGRTTAIALKTKSSTDESAVTRLYINRLGHITPGADNTQTLGSASLRWSTVYAGTGTINTSDEREKSFIDITETEIAVATELKGMIRKFKFNDAILEKGESHARIHFGVGAQSVAAVFVKHGLDPNKYALFCYDKWDERPEIVDDFGNVTQQYRAAGDRFGIRYEELLCFILCSI